MACTPGISRWQTWRVIAIAIVIAPAWTNPADADAEACAARDDVLGTSRVLTLDESTSRVGRKQFPVTLPLHEKEVILTFDDGPLTPTTGRVLDALANECVRATFFAVGRMAKNAPALLRRALAEGHTVAHHSDTHRLLSRMRPDAAMAEIDRGMTAVETALYGAKSEKPRTPFFRFPGFASTPALLDRLAARGIVVFGADLWASDWNRMTPQQELRQVLRRLAQTGGGILLMHDTKRSTVTMLPELLRQLKKRGYKVVHVVPAANVPP